MTLPLLLAHDERILVLAPTVADAALALTHLGEAGFGCHLCADLAGLEQAIGAGAGAVLLTDESLAIGDTNHIVSALANQQPWSDVPIVLLTSNGADSPIAVWAMNLLGNVTVLERPVRLTTLISNLRAALRARRRQYQLREQMAILQRQGAKLRLLWEAAAVLLTTESPDEMMRHLFAKIAPQFELDAYFNFMVDETGEALRMESCSGISQEAAKGIARLEFGQAICGAVAARQQPLMATHIQKSDDPKVQRIKSFGLRVYACNPLMAGDRLLGTLSFASRSKDRFDNDELEFLQTVCHYVAYAYERLRLIRQLREEDAKKDDFLATLAHELRNPLAPIRNAVQYFRLKGPADPDLQNAHEIIDRQVRQMSRLVDDLLDISRITRGKIVLQRNRVSLGLILTNAVESSRPLIAEANHELSLTLPKTPLFVNGDAVRLSQIFGNLLNNAAKYTDRGGSIRVSAEQRETDVVIAVSDTGIGIAAEHVPRLFDMFSQVDPALERSQGGLGIGLALVKSLVELHGGRVEAQSPGLGKGSRFEVRLPLAGETRSAPDLESSGSGNLKSHRKAAACRILVADDNVDAAESLSLLLSVMGHELRTVHDGVGAVEVAEKFEPDLILLDIGMPKMNGYEAARHIRKLPWGRKAVLAALTGWGQESDKRRAEEAGFDFHFTKPVDPAALEHLLAGKLAAEKTTGRQ